MNFDINFKKIARVIGIISGGLPLRQIYRFWQALFRNTLRSKIGLIVENLLKFTIKLVLGPGMALTGIPEGKILIIDKVSQNRQNAIKNHEV